MIFIIICCLTSSLTINISVISMSGLKILIQIKQHKIMKYHMIDWCLTPTLVVFQLYNGVEISHSSFDEQTYL